MKNGNYYNLRNAPKNIFCPVGFTEIIFNCGNAPAACKAGVGARFEPEINLDSHDFCIVLSGVYLLNRIM